MSRVRLAAGRLTFLGLAAASLAAVGAVMFKGDFETPQKVIGTVAALWALAAGVWRVLARWSAPRVSTPEQLDAAARALAEAVESQWRAEAAVLDLNSPNPAQVRWMATRRPVTDPAAVRWRTSTGPPVAAGTDPPATGGLDDLVRCYRESPGGRLVILGAAGTGKTVTAVLLVLAGLRARPSGDPVPALISIAAWDPRTEHLVDHVAALLNRDHPYLMNPEYGAAAAAGLLTTGRVTPVLDGFDELAADRRRAAMNGLNRSGLSRMVVTSRPEEYEDATESVVLTGAEVVELLPLGIDALTGSITAGCAPRQLTRWEPVFANLRTHLSGPAATALANPLVLALAKQTYADRDPGELLDARFDTAQAVRAHLLDGFVRARYDADRDGPAGPRPQRYGGHRPLHWLAFLARWMESRQTLELAWWHIIHMVRPGPRIVATLVVFGGLAWVCSEQIGGGRAVLGIALAGTPLIWAVVAWRQRTGAFAPATLGRMPGLPQLRHGLTVGALVGITLTPIVAIAILIRDQAWTDSGNDELSIALVVGLAIGVIVGGVVAAGAAVRRCAPATAPQPRRSFRAHLRFLLAGQILPAVVIPSPVIVILAATEEGGPSFEHTLGPALTYVLLLAAAMVLAEAGGQYLIAVGILAVSGKTPWRPLRFLTDAHQRGILRQQGATYQFRHTELQTRIAAVDTAAAQPPLR